MAEAESRWTNEILERLREWQSWAEATLELHYGRTRSLTRRVRLLAASAVVLSAGAAIWLVALPSAFAEVAWMVGALTTGAAAVASALYTFLRYGEKAEEHRQMAERWFALRREIDQMLALHPEYLASRDPELYIADLRARIEDESARSRSLIESGGWREIAAQQRLEFRASSIVAAAKRATASRRPRDGSPSLFTEPARNLLADWERRAAASSDAHFAVGQRLASLNVRLGGPAVVVLAADAAFLLLLRDGAPPSSRFALGIGSVLAAALVALSASLRATERAASHSFAAEMWARLRGEIDDVLRSPPRRVQADPKRYLDDLRRQMDELSAQSPEVGEDAWMRALGREGGRRAVSTTDAAERFASVFPGVNLRVEDEAARAAS